MDEAFLGQIALVSFNKIPDNWALCNGQVLPINANPPLYTLLGTTYGGDGINTFALPDLQGRLPIGMGQGSGLSTYPLGATGGTEGVSLQTDQIPSHLHAFTGTLNASANQDFTSPADGMPATGTMGQFSTGPADASMGGVVSGTTTTVGQGQGHENRQPLMALTYLICVSGAFPPHN